MMRSACQIGCRRLQQINASYRWQLAKPKAHLKVDLSYLISKPILYPAISATLHAQHAMFIFISLASKMAALDADLRKIKALYIQLSRSKTGFSSSTAHTYAQRCQVAPLVCINCHAYRRAWFASLWYISPKVRFRNETVNQGCFHTTDPSAWMNEWWRMKETSIMEYLSHDGLKKWRGPIESFCNRALTICFGWGSSDFGCGAEMMQCGVKEYLALKLLFNIINDYKDSI